MSVRFKLATLITALGVMLAGLCLEDAWHGWARVAASNQISWVNQISDALLRANGALAVERGTVQGALRAGGTVAGLNDQQRNLVADKRSETNAAFSRAGDAIAGLEKVRSGELQHAVAAWMENQRRVAALRARLDRVIAEDGSDAGLAEAWFPGLTELIMSAAAVSDAVALAALDGELDVRVQRGLAIKRAFWEMSEFAGRERGGLNGFIASGTQLTGQRLQALGIIRGRIDSAWSVIMMAVEGSSAELRTAIAAINDRYFGTFDKLRQDVYRAGADGGRYPVAAPEWFAQATQSIEAILQAQKIATADVSSLVGGEMFNADVQFARALGILVIALIAVFAAIWVLSRQVLRPLAALQGAMGRLAERELATEIVGVGRRDEIGAMARAVKVFKDNMIRADELDAEREATRGAEQRRAARIEALVNAFQARIGDLVGMLASASTELEATAQSMATTATATHQQAATVASAAGQAGVGVQTVAAATDQLTASIGEINRQAVHSARMTEQATVTARRTDATVRALAEEAHKIEDVIGLITRIAAQTNLLALNATIEAARAGDAGKGFAVVASEVKGLAQQTGKATEQVSAQIGRIQTATEEAVAAITEIAGVVEEISHIVTAISAAVEEQGAATSEIARNVQQTAQATQEVTANINGVSQAANDTGAAANQVLGSAGHLARQTVGLSGAVAEFIREVQAA